MNDGHVRREVAPVIHQSWHFDRQHRFFQLHLLSHCTFEQRKFNVRKKSKMAEEAQNEAITITPPELVGTIFDKEAVDGTSSALFAVS